MKTRYVYYSHYDNDGIRKFIYWDTKEKTFAIAKTRYSMILAPEIALFSDSIINYLNIKMSGGHFIKHLFNPFLAIIIPLITLIIYEIILYIQNNKEKDFYDLNINDVDTLIKIIYKTRKNMVKYFVKGELCLIIFILIFISSKILRIPGIQQLYFLIIFYIIEIAAVVIPFQFYVQGHKIAKELKQQYPLTK